MCGTCNVWSKKWSSKNEHEWIGAGLKNEVKKKWTNNVCWNKNLSIFLCKERHGLCFGLTAFKYTSIVIQKLNRILNIRYNKKKSHQVVVGDKHESKIFQHEKSKPKYWTWIALNDKEWKKLEKLRGIGGRNTVCVHMGQ